MKLCTFVADLDRENIGKIEAHLRSFCERADVEKLSFYSCSMSEAADRISDRDWMKLHIAMVSLDFPGANELGERLYRANPACRLIYYGHGPDRGQIALLLPSRPVWYWDAEDMTAFSPLLQQQMDAMKTDPYFFYYSDRLRSMAVPIHTIHCAYSQKRYVYLNTLEGDIGPIPRSLDDIAKKLPAAGFLRVHRSFLVRKNSVRRLERKTKELELISGMKVPVSRAFYDQAVTLFEPAVKTTVSPVKMTT